MSPGRHGPSGDSQHVNNVPRWRKVEITVEAPRLEEEIGQLGVKALHAFKRTLDPAGIMNPGVLLTL